jgi:hypothetical protein
MNVIEGTKCRERRWVGHVAYIGRGEEYIEILVVNPEGKRLLGR